MTKRPGGGEHVDTVFVNGPILTMDGDAPTYAEAVVARQGRITFVGARDDAVSKFPDAEIRDLAGQTLLPGFVDAHSHLSFGFDLVNQVDVGAPPVGHCTDIASVIAELEKFRDTRAVPEGGWIVGWGYDQETLAEDRHITKLDLDAAFPDHRIVLIHISSHGAVFNSAALAAAGIDANTPTPDGGVIARLPASQEPAGLLMETAYFRARTQMPRLDSATERLKLLDDVQQLYASNGYTHAQDGFTPVVDLDFFVSAAEQGLLYLDVAALGSFVELDAWIDNPVYPKGEYRGGFKVAGMKAVYDGSPQGRTAYVTAPYLTGGPNEESDWVGEPNFPYSLLVAKLKQAAGAGIQSFVHVNGDAAIDDLIRAVRELGLTAADDRRTVPIHSQFQRADHLDSYVELGLTPSYFTNHTFFWGDVHVTNLGAEKAGFISPLKAAAGRGLVVSNHSDFTVTPLNPFFIMWTAMTRTTRSGAVLGPDQRVDAYAALQALTTGPAYQVFEEDRKGRIAEGLLADFVILSADPIATGADGVRDITVVETIKEGVTVFRA
ncbi:hypothetical protein CLV47_111127 [Antricoccus suffuscus]|uniref:Amidohydrolase 3 domain-containing protein n=1 Tax=Antricoccus suffuscus TaxID=1629062 RepID=A0A2T0ZY13_9ACTN|nr:amidohydrolase [Antricoccus suffuscus]PRZ41249.1 hypothetical protein CLV47_111127 [Antricoccus suffuscus]